MKAISIYQLNRKKTFIYFLTGTLVLLFFISIVTGRVKISISEILSIFKIVFSGDNFSESLTSNQLVFWWIRLPRCIMAVIVGMGLSVSGAVYQALFRNPLVSPDILGVAAGCTFGAALGLILPVESFSLVHILAFVFGIIAVSMSMGIAKLIAVKPVIVLVLAGMVVLSFFNALLMILKYFSDPYDELPNIVFWIMGSLTRVTWHDVYTALPVTGCGLVLFMLLRFRLNILSLGDIQAKSLGMNPSIFRITLIAASSFIVAMTVATCGQICWIGLIIPHMARTIAGPEHENMIPVTALLGAIFMLTADMAARSITSAEIPVGIITALTGAPIFGFLLYKNRGSGWL
ncbi:MAG: iron ABC transporter permease [Thermodesulfobacteriota bacterium]|nr:iron ABC transporter permease [Thermodesulfobacteriota bacterium]